MTETTMTLSADSLAQAAATPPARAQLGAGTYAELKRRIVADGLLVKRPLFYFKTTLVTLGLFAAGIAILATVDELWVVLLDAMFMAAIFAQVAFLGHDTGHRQIFRSRQATKLMGYLVTLLLGVSISWWVDKHNRHHSFPNEVSVDPDLDLPMLAFSEEEAAAKRGAWRFMARYQSYFFLPILAFEGVGLRLASLQFIVRRNRRYPIMEPVLVLVHSVAYVGLLVSVLSIRDAILFATAHHLLTGLYLGSIFAPNHKGMPLTYKGQVIDFLYRQILTSRNITSNPPTDFLYGGQNYQIEHHLFPSMPRCNLHRAQVIVKAFCREQSIPYGEASIVGSYREILRHLHRVSSPLRARPA